MRFVKFIIKNCSKKKEKYIRDYLDATDIEYFTMSLVSSYMKDRMIYGYNPWDYLEETKLNMKYQNFIPVMERIKNGKF
jgi:hypothetical protein